jgi:hypothetical protein
MPAACLVPDARRQPSVPELLSTLEPTAEAIEILAKSTKANQAKVINRLRQPYGD